jgi:hypothetical protein
MPTSAYRETAKIYAFPTRERAVANSLRDSAKSAADLAAARLPRIEFGSGWYHDAAIQEDAETRKR